MKKHQIASNIQWYLDTPSTLSVKDYQLAQYLHHDHHSAPMLSQKQSVAWMDEADKWSDVINGPIIHVGHGGSVLGPKCLATAFSSLRTPKHELYFWSTPDQRCKQLQRLFHDKTTSVIFVSKSMTTDELLTQKAIIDHHIDVTRQFIVTADPKKALNMGFLATHIIVFPNWVSGRFSVWGATSTSIYLGWGRPWMQEWLNGAKEMDLTICYEKPQWFHQWVIQSLEKKTYFIALYGKPFANFIPYIQQVMMETLGKFYAKSGDKNYFFQYVLGDIGPDFQHASLQLLTSDIADNPIDIWVEGDQHSLARLAYAQALGLRFGGDQCRENKCVSLGIISSLTPHAIGAMMTMYELKALALAEHYQLDPFNQPGVALGKSLLAKTSIDKHFDDYLCQISEAKS
ncbi:MAG: hypothetical protein ACON5A_05905 [Candidatus Comchoanobacterales bacterium]